MSCISVHYWWNTSFQEYWLDLAHTHTHTQKRLSDGGLATRKHQQQKNILLLLWELWLQYWLSRLNSLLPVFTAHYPPILWTPWQQIYRRRLSYLRTGLTAVEHRRSLFVVLGLWSAASGQPHVMVRYLMSHEVGCNFCNLIKSAQVRLL